MCVINFHIKDQDFDSKNPVENLGWVDMTEFKHIVPIKKTKIIHM